MNSVYHHDLLEIVSSLEEKGISFRGKNVFLTGGTGFLGKWLVDTLLLQGANLTLFTRSAEKAVEQSPHWKDHSAIRWVEGSLNQIPPLHGFHDAFIHGASDLNFSAAESLEAARIFFDFAEREKIPNVLFLSSGAAAHYQPGKPNTYAEGKILIEQEGITRSQKGAFSFKIARCFAFVGPHQDLKSHFAAPQFFRDVLAQKEIVIQGDGSPIRSFLYPSDFAEGILTILQKGKSAEVYDLGSDEAVFIRQLAELINICREGEIPSLRILGAESKSLSQSNSYLPDLSKIKQELGFQTKVNLQEAIRRTALFYRETFPNSKIRAATR